MRLKMLTAMLILNTCLHLEAALASETKVSTASSETLIADERSALDVEIGAAQTRWTYNVVQALLNRNQADDVALASLLLAVHYVETGVGCGEKPSCVDGQSDLKTLAQDRLALGALALERADELSYLMLRLVSEQQMKRLDEAQQDELLALMIARAPDDWLSWMSKLATLENRGVNEEQISHELAQAAQSIKGSREWLYAMTREVANAYALVPTPAGMLALMQQQNLAARYKAEMAFNEENVRLVSGFGYSMAIAVPQLQTLHVVCKEENPQFVQRRPACTRIAKALATQSHSILDRQFGLSMWHRLVEGSTEEALVIAAKRRHHWLLESATTVRSELWGNSDDMALLLASVQDPKSSEISYNESLLQEAGIDSEPPDAWQPLNPAVLRARR